MYREQSIERAWRIFLGLMIVAAAAFTVLLVYSAFFATLTRNWQVATVQSGMAAGLGLATAWLCYNRNELVGLQ